MIAFLYFCFRWHKIYGVCVCVSPSELAAVDNQHDCYPLQPTHPPPAGLNSACGMNPLLSRHWFLTSGLTATQLLTTVLVPRALIYVQLFKFCTRPRIFVPLSSKLRVVPAAVQTGF